MDNTINSNVGSRQKNFFKTIEKAQVFFLAGIFFLILFYALYLTREIVVPFVIALLFNFLLTPLIRILRRFYLPAQVSAGLVIILLLLIVGSFFYGLVQPATSWLSKGPEAISAVNHKLTVVSKSISGPLNYLSKIGEGIPLLTFKKPVSNPNIASDKVSFVIGTVAVTWEFLIEFVTTILLLYFFLSYDNFFVRKIVHWITSFERKREAVNIAHKIHHQIFRYLFARTLINIGLGICVSITMFILGMPDPILWGVMTGFLEYIPYLGALISIVVIAIVALFTFTSIAYSFLVVFLFFMLVFIESNIVSPIIFGRAFTLNPIMIFLSLLFFTWMWGIAGSFIAVPMLVTLRVIAEAL